jgi:hypothetical protein
MTDETQPASPASPTGQMVGLSKLWNELPAGVQTGVVLLVFVAVVLSPAVVAQPDAFPAWAKVLIVSLAGLGGPIGMISGGVRK